MPAAISGATGIIGLFIASLVLLVGAAELFTNAIEWIGFRFNLSHGATGGILAAIGTALPETMVPIVALVANSKGASSIAIGTVLGAPFLLLTLVMAITGAVILTRGKGVRVLAVDHKRARRDLAFFIIPFSLMGICVLLAQPLRIAGGICLLCFYGAYLWITLRTGNVESSEPDPLHIFRWGKGSPPIILIMFQLVAAALLLIVGAQWFVDALTVVGAHIKVSPFILALFLVPLATELPEALSSALWIRSGYDVLAYGNVVGAAIFQACILGFIGVVFTPWNPKGLGIVSMVLTLMTAIYLYILFSLRQRAIQGWYFCFPVIVWIAYIIIVIVSGTNAAAST